MNRTHTLQVPWIKATHLLDQALERAGLTAVPSFDLRSAREALLDPDCCPCPSHGSIECSCQYIIYLVDDGQGQPLSIEIHGHDDQTFITVIPPFDGGYNESSLRMTIEAINQFEVVLKRSSS